MKHSWETYSDGVVDICWKCKMTRVNVKDAPSWKNVDYLYFDNPDVTGFQIVPELDCKKFLMKKALI